MRQVLRMVTAHPVKERPHRWPATAEGGVQREYVGLNCSGMWAREVGRLADVDVPLQAAEHYYLISEPVPSVHPLLPILRDPGNAAYIREEAGKIMLGLFEPIARPWRVPEDFAFGEIPPDWDRLQPYIERAMRRVPSLLNTGIKLLFCGPESFTADHNYLMGEAPNLQNFFVAAGFNSLGILSGGGAGFVMAHWLVDGHPPMDVWSVNLRRTQSWQNNSRYLGDRIVESLGIGYQDHWPFRQWTTARDVKKSVLHDRLAAVGACFGESAGWERPNWYVDAGQPRSYHYAWGRQNWFANSAAEHQAVRQRVGVFEQSSFAKLLVQGRDAVQVLNRLSTAECDVAPGTAVYTPVPEFTRRHRGGSDRHAARGGSFPGWSPRHSRTPMWKRGSRTRSPKSAHCFITEVSGAYSMLNVQGPASRALLQAVSSDDLSNAGFAFRHCREIRIGYQTVLALRLSYVGELGWELYIPTAFTLPVYDALIAAGGAFGLQHCGYHALNSLRIEKAYRDWGHDLGSDDSPLEAGLAFTCAWDKPGGFVGREALLQQRASGPPRRRLVQFRVDDPDAMLYHNEPIYRDGEAVGITTSGMYGHTLGGAVALGYVRARSRREQ